MVKIKNIVLIGFVFGLYFLAGCATHKAAPPAPLASATANAVDPAQYDQAMIERIHNRWYALRSDMRYKAERQGKVVVRFRVHSDGTVSDLKFEHDDGDTVAGILGKEAIRQSAPFASWPPELTKMIGRDYREITVTFPY